MDKLSGKNSALLMVVVLVLGGVLWATGLTDKITGATKGSSTESSSGADRPYDAIEMRVRNVADSGTFTATVVTTSRYADKGLEAYGDGRVTVRLYGVDTPGASYRQECYAEEAKESLEKRLSESSQRIWVKPGRDDRRGRALAWVWTKDGELLQESQLADGAATLRDDATFAPYEEQVTAAEAKAEKAKTGLWGACGS